MGNGATGGFGARFWSRRVRRGVVVVVVVVIAGFLASSFAPIAAVPAPTRAADPFAAVDLPPDLGQSETSVFIPETGHTLSGTMLDYWRATGGAATFGNPISEPFASTDGFYSQAFVNGVLQYRPDVLYTVDPIVRLAPLGRVLLGERLDGRRGDERRPDGGGNRLPVWLPVNPNGETAAAAINTGGLYDTATGHTVGGAFAAWYAAHEGAFYLGSPISEPFVEGGRVVQYFDGAVLTEAPNGVGLLPLGAEMAADLGIDTAPVAQNGLPVYDESLFLIAPNPLPQGDPAAPGPRRIEINVSQQQLWAYQGETLILTSPISSGLDPNDTELGRFHVRIKYELQDMTGFTDDTGEVVAFGEVETPPAGTVGSYDVKDIPHIMYFNLDAEALHGAYWHSNFGQRMSHGCVNLPLDVAAFLYGWAPLGTSVWVHE